MIETGELIKHCIPFKFFLVLVQAICPICPREAESRHDNKTPLELNMDQHVPRTDGTDCLDNHQEELKWNSMLDQLIKKITDFLKPNQEGVLENQ